jgi:hypothetical protein
LLQRTHVQHVQRDLVSDASRLLCLEGLGVQRVESESEARPETWVAQSAVVKSMMARGSLQLAALEPRACQGHGLLVMARLREYPSQ